MDTQVDTWREDAQRDRPRGYEGAIGDFTSHAPILCSTGGSTQATVTPVETNAYYLVVPHNSGREGSYGTNSLGQEIPQASSPCLPA